MCSSDLLGHRKPHWLPIVEQKGTLTDITQVNNTLGVGICEGIARLWHVGKDSKLELFTETSEIIELTGDIPSVLLRDSRIRPNDTIRPINSNYLVTAPSI